MQNNTLILFIVQQNSASIRYRTLHHQEQYAISSRFTNLYVSLITIALCVKNCTLYLHRVPLTSRTLPLVLAARLRRIPIIFDSDDLVWDSREREYNFLDTHYSPEVVAQILKGTRRMHAMMRLADAFVFSTPYLAARAALDFKQPRFVNENALSSEQVTLSSAAIRTHATPDGKIIIGYFSGQAKVHDEDFASIAPAIQHILDSYPHVQLRIYGGLVLPTALRSSQYASRIEKRAAVDWRELPAHIAQVDINIAPLVENPQRRSKSAVKYLEAAAVAVPTVAVDMEPYAIIRHGETGLLAGNIEQWQSALSTLIENTALRQRIGQAAREDVLANHTTAARAPQFARIIEQVTRR